MSEPSKAVSLDAAIDQVAEDLAASSWDRITEFKVDQDTGETQIVVADEPAAPEVTPEATPEVAPQPPLDQGDPALRKWATQVSQRNALVEAEVQSLKQKQLDADAALDKDEFVERFAAALPEDMSQVYGDRKAFAKVITVAADRLADRKTKEVQAQLDTARQALAGMGQALEFVAALNPEFGELQPIIASAVRDFADKNPGDSLFNHFTHSALLGAARAFRDQTRGQHPQQTATQATISTGQATSPPQTAPAQREARPADSKAAQAASTEGISLDERSTRDIGRQQATGRNAFSKNVSAVIDDIFGDSQGI